MKSECFLLKEPFIRADHLLQSIGAAQSGGEAGFFIRSGLLRVNGKVTVEKRKKLLPGDEIEFKGQLLVKLKGA